MVCTYLPAALNRAGVELNCVELPHESMEAPSKRVTFPDFPDWDPEEKELLRPGSRGIFRLVLATFGPV